MKTSPANGKPVPASLLQETDTPESSRFIDKSVTPSSPRKTPEPEPYTTKLPSQSLYQRALNVIKPVAHFIRYRERLASRIKVIETSRTTPQKRLPFLNENLEEIARQFNGDEAAKLFDFSAGCCFGLTSNYILYETLGQQDEFDSILSTLSQNPEKGWVFWGQYYPNLADAIAEAQVEVKLSPKTTDQDTRLLLLLRPFCESLLLFQNPNNTVLRSTIPFQDANTAAQFLASEHLEEDAVLKSTPYYIAGLKLEGLEKLCLHIGSTISEQQPERFFHISSGGHIIAMKVTRQGYEIFDQNITNYRRFIPRGDEKQLASVLKDRIQAMPTDISIPFHNNSIFEIKEYHLTPSRLTTTTMSHLKAHLDQIPFHDHCPINEQNFNGNNQIHLAALANNVEEIRRLLSHSDLDINAVRDKNKSNGVKSTALHLAIEKSNIEAVQLLLNDRRCSAGLLCPGNFSALWLATNNGCKPIVEALLKAAPQYINTPDKVGQPPLFVAALRNHYDIAKLLIAQPDIDVNQNRADGATPLHTASYHGNLDALRVLLSHKKIELSSGTKEGETPLEMAAKNGHNQCVSLLLEHGALVDEQCIEAAETAGHHLIAQQLKEKHTLQLLPPGASK